MEPKVFLLWVLVPAPLFETNIHMPHAPALLVESVLLVLDLITALLLEIALEGFLR
jgi:hypothetical protein